MKEYRLLVAMAATGATIAQAAEQFRTSTETIQRISERFEIQLKGSQAKLGLKATGK